MNNVVYFELNNWFSGRDYPEGEPYETWMNDFYFDNEEWVKENKLCVVAGFIDMSRNYCISAPREWVEKNCPSLLSDGEFESVVIRGPEAEVITSKHRYSDFLREPDEDGDVYGRFGWKFLEYEEENIGIIGGINSDFC